ncbi:membrane protein [Saccharothrix sp. NRRL B-16348]|nr:membrane protein [Saccharothrix sp. NRRL B-16348]
MVSATQTGLLAGLVLGLAATGGFTAFLVTLAVGVIGLVAGRVLDGELDLGDLFGRGRDK